MAVVDVSKENLETIDAYSALGPEFYDSQGDDGGFARRALLNPAIFRLLGEVAGRRILDAGCGGGYLSRLLAQRGAVMVGIEPANVAYRYAEMRERAQPLGIHSCSVIYPGLVT